MGPTRARHRRPLKYFLANWKMYPTVDEARDLFEAVQRGIRERVHAGTGLPQVIVCPPFVSLAPLRATPPETPVRLGAQNCHWEDEGPYTGEISPKMLRGLADYVMVGHSERRAMGETDEQIAGKVAAVVRNGLVPILFVGEDDRSDDGLRQTEHRLRQGLSHIDLTQHEALVVYEPSWAIGVHETAPPEHVHRSVAHLKDVLAQLGASEPGIVYGGSVTEDNIDELVQLEVLDGLGATRASLRPEGFLNIVDRVAAA